MVLRYPRYIHAEVLTHRQFSRNAESSRAMPVKRKLELIRNDPVFPIEFGVNKPGMQATEVLTLADEKLARESWARALDAVLKEAEFLNTLNVHKQVTNRLAECFATISVIVTSTKWRNFDFLRDHPAADPHIQFLARLRKQAYDASTPKPLKDGEWHLPFITSEDYPNTVDILKKISAARCARVSLLNHEGKRPGVDEDTKLFNRLVSRDNPENDPGHWTPLEHQATPITGIRFNKAHTKYLTCERCNSPMLEGQKYVFFECGPRNLSCMKCALGHVTSGNFHGWHQFRKEFPFENFDA